MNYKEICDLIKTVSESKLTSFEIEVDGMHIRMGKYDEPIIVNEKPSNIKIKNEDVKEAKEVKESSEIAVENITPVKAKETQDDTNIVIIKSPIVGTFYESPSPDKGSFVEIGSKVKKGDTLCIIEAMKLMNDIEAEVAGEVVDILVKNEEMVEYGQPLFKIRK